MSTPMPPGNGWPTTTVPSPGQAPPVTPQFYPFGAPPGLSQPPLPYDVILDKSYPRVGFVPQEQGGIYAEMVEVNGDLWIVQNATFDPNLQGFYQYNTTTANCDPGTNAYAWCFRGTSGDAIRFIGPSTGTSANPVVWQQVFDAAPNGVNISPVPIMSPNSPALQVNAVFNGSVSQTLTAFAVHVNDVSSAPDSILEKLTVNGNIVWEVDKTGTLVTGNIGAATLVPPVYTYLAAGTGIAPIAPAPGNSTLPVVIGLEHGDYVDLASNQVITGVKTIQSPNADDLPPTPLKFGFGTSEIVGGPNDDLYETSGSEITNFPSTDKTQTLTAIARSNTSIILGFNPQPGIIPDIGANEPGIPLLAVFIDTGLTVNNHFPPTMIAWFDQNYTLNLIGGLTVGGAVSFSGGLSITGGLTVGGKLTLNGGFSLNSEPAVTGLLQSFTPLNFDPTVNPVTSKNFGSGLVIGYVESLNQIVWDTSQLAFIGTSETSGPGIFSSDGTVEITKDPTKSQNVNLSVASSVASAFKVYAQGGGGTPISNPIAQFGNVNNIALSGTGGPNGGTSSGTQQVNFAKNFTNGNYGLSISATGGWLVVNVLSTSTGGFTFNVGDIGTQTSASISWVAIGS